MDSDSSDELQEEDTTAASYTISRKKVKVKLILFNTNDVYFNEYV
jgi:hypothetical protein